ncbi:hypothetical protein GCM10027277_33440 [Pseudoduganella ginsengisoli]|uniref:PEP-CTERM sorting domain-containing protein n=1 Tax=Pseudoduganella ginsengisoli TaxID=1462440 RepID=A0A6L6Q7Y9_9BURK|nr:PEP-CTERM sorting domain-containing protein [Pseudoduganella ginsengisoli]MTW05328.1 PEP-CTERM sorting domain-containing protein [Pseudoduganella ginsengisoli]
MHTVLKKALLLATLLAAARHAAAVEILAAPAQPSTDDTYLLALADAAVTASPAPPDISNPSPVPEPPVYIMLLVGVGLLGLVARRETVPPVFRADPD